MSAMNRPRKCLWRHTEARPTLTFAGEVISRLASRRCSEARKQHYFTIAAFAPEASANSPSHLPET
eukprot:1632380-Pleurochrysis_carterae.AAC.2